MQKIFNMMMATAMMLFIISCSKEESNPVEPEKKPTISMVLIPAGTFQMGNTCKGVGWNDEKPVHTVTLTNSLYISKYEVTQEQYEAVTGKNPSNFKGENLPVETVSWYDAVSFCNKLSQIEGKSPCYIVTGSNVICDWEANGYRLPTEAEWEYACKAGTNTAIYSGNLIYEDSTPLDPNLDNIGWYVSNSLGKTHPVGQKEANAFGLYDMSGNVWEWCWDRYDTTYTSESRTNPKGSPTGLCRVFRGGSWFGSAYYCRSSHREYYFPENKYYYVGFRIVRLNK